MIANQQELDLGKIKFGQPFKFNFTLTNTGKDSAIVTKLVTGCSSCTKASCRRTYVKPGSTTDIDVVFTPGSKGKQTKSVNVIYNHNENILLKFTAEVDD